MLKLKHKYHLDFPHVTFSLPHPMRLSPVTADDDELSQAIASDPVTHDNAWDLSDLDTSELEAYWLHVEADLKNDPKWIDFGKG